MGTGGGRCRNWGCSADDTITGGGGGGGGATPDSRKRSTKV